MSLIPTLPTPTTLDTPLGALELRQDRHRPWRLHLDGAGAGAVWTACRQLDSARWGWDDEARPLWLEALVGSRYALLPAAMTAPGAPRAVLFQERLQLVIGPRAVGSAHSASWVDCQAAEVAWDRYPVGEGVEWGEVHGGSHYAPTGALTAWMLAVLADPAMGAWFDGVAGEMLAREARELCRPYGATAAMRHGLTGPTSVGPSHAVARAAIATGLVRRRDVLAHLLADPSPAIREAVLLHFLPDQATLAQVPEPPRKAALAWAYPPRAPRR